MVKEELKERVERFKSLIKQGYNISKALKESGLHIKKYKRHNDVDLNPSDFVIAFNTLKFPCRNLKKD
ncbi:MAG: hypothetical protein QXH00_10990 [Candidatus Jordarchaeales archaeon]